MPTKKSPSPSSSLTSFPWGIILKIIVSTGLIVWLSQNVNLGRVWGLIQQLEAINLCFVLTIIWITLFAVAKRWQLILNSGNVEAPFPYLTRATFIGAFFNQFLPSSVGGDFFRILRARRYGAPLITAVTSVFMDRLFGFISLALLCLLTLPTQGHALLNSELKWPFVLTLLLLAGVFGGMFLLLLIPSTWHTHFLIRPFQSVLEMIKKAWHSKGLFLSILASSLIASIFLILGLQVLMMAFHIPLSWTQGSAILPAVMLLTSLPISFAGWGLREGAIIMALGIYNVPQEAALAVSLIYGILQLLSGAPGLVLWILDKRRQKPATS